MSMTFIPKMDINRILLLFGSDRLPNVFYHLIGDPVINSSMLVDEVMPIANPVQLKKFSFSKEVTCL
jgi:hypothetical protein